MPRIPYEKLLESGTYGYTEHLTDLRDIAFDEAVKELKRHASSILGDIETFSGHKIERFTFGKTYALKKNDVKFDPMDISSWGVEIGLNGCWPRFKKEGFHGLIVICATSIPKAWEQDTDHHPLRDRQMLAEAYKVQLIHHFAYNEPEAGRLRNETFAPGKKSEKVNVAAGVVFLAYKLKKGKERKYSEA